MGTDIPEQGNPGENKPSAIVVDDRLKEVWSPLKKGEHCKKVGLVHLPLRIGFDVPHLFPILFIWGQL